MKFCHSILRWRCNKVFDEVLYQNCCNKVLYQNCCDEVCDEDVKRVVKRL